MENQESPSLRQREAIDRLADEFEAAFRAGQPLDIERLVADNPHLRPYLLKELISIEIELRGSLGAQTSVEDYRSRFPQDAILVDEVFFTTQVHGNADQKYDANVIVDDTLFSGCLEKADLESSKNTSTVKAWPFGLPSISPHSNR